MVQKKGPRLFRTGFAIFRPIRGIPVNFGIEESGKDKELLGPTGLLDLLIHPRKVLKRQACLSGGGFGRALACWILVGVSRAMEALALSALNCRSVGVVSRWQANHSL